ncbi:MAG: ROK family protein [Bacteroidales bacterium]|nr:ROK family protein [Bacteroidales bacterium]
MREAVIGIDIGGTYTKYGIIDRQGNNLADSKINTDENPDFDVYLKHLSSALAGLLKEVKEEVAVKGIGIGAPNANYYKGTIEYPPNLSWKGIIPVVDKMKAHYPGIPIVITNDANAAAIGEMVYGGARQMKDFIVITLGTGLGSGIVVNGQLVYGHDGFAGELGHVNVKLRGRDCGCGRKGCLETYVSATGIKRTIFRLLAERTEESELRNTSFNELSAITITDLARKGDPIALEAFEYTGRILGAKLADTVAHTSPEAIFLLGGLANARELILDPTQRSLEENLLPIYRNKIKVLLSSLSDVNAAVMGASALAWNELERP